jgi:hypothetical protein
MCIVLVLIKITLNSGFSRTAQLRASGSSSVSLELVRIEVLGSIPGATRFSR